VEKERDALYDKFEATIYDVQQKSGFKNILLERKLATVNETLEQKDAQLSEVLSAANLDPAVLGSVSKRLDDVRGPRCPTNAHISSAKAVARPR